MPHSSHSAGQPPGRPAAEPGERAGRCLRPVFLRRYCSSAVGMHGQGVLKQLLQLAGGGGFLCCSCSSLLGAPVALPQLVADDKYEREQRPGPPDIAQHGWEPCASVPVGALWFGPSLVVSSITATAVAARPAAWAIAAVPVWVNAVAVAGIALDEGTCAAGDAAIAGRCRKVNTCGLQQVLTSLLTAAAARWKCVGTIPG